jgi:hypothetical protein
MFHVQRRFQHQKGDEEATRVCWGCRDNCLRKREQASKNVLMLPGCFGIAGLRKKRLRMRKEESKINERFEILWLRFFCGC